MNAVAQLPDGDVKPLQGYTDGRQRLRIGKYRVIFKISGENLYVIEIGSRGDIYK
jgi:mRNA interferase RelE/StbE